MMPDQQYNELRKADTKEVLANLIKADIRQRFLQPYVSMYCQQFDEFKNVTEFIEFWGIVFTSARQRVNEQPWCHAMPALPAPTLYPKQIGSLRKGQGVRCSSRYPQGITNLWQACGSRADRRQSCPVLYP